MEYEFIPIVYPNKPDDTSIPPPLVATIQTTTTEVVPGQGLPFIASAPYVAPPPIPEPTPLPPNGVLVDPAGTLVYHPLTSLPATTTFNQTDNYSLPSLVTTMGGDQSLYAPYNVAEAAKDWSLYPAIQQVDISGFGITGAGDISGVANMNFLNNSVMTNVGDLNFANGSKMLNVGDMDFGANATMTGVKEIVVSQSGFGSLTINTDGIQSAGDITGIDSLELNTQVLTAIPNALLLNGVPIATISNLPNIYQWANYPALSVIQMNAPGTAGPHEMIGVANIQWAQGTTLIGEQNPVSPANPSGSNARFYALDTPNDAVPKIIYSTDLSGAYAAPGTYTGVPKWATFKPSQDVDWDGKQITNINEITFNTAIPQLGGASINALNDLNFSLVTALAGYAGVNNVNNIAFWNPNFPGIPGAYVNLYSKNLTYAGNSAVYLATDTRISAPSLFLGGLAGTAGGKLEILGENAVVATINGSPCSASWATYPCGNPAGVNMNGQQILACRQIDFQNDNPAPIHNLLSIDNQGYLTYEFPPGNNVRITPPSAWSTFPATQNVNAAGFNINNLGQLQFNFDPNNILNITNGTTLTWRGQPVQTGGAPDNVANWANYQAVNDVTIPPDHALSINAANTLIFYKDSQLNTNIYHGVETNLDNPDFISFPTTFQVGNEIGEPARVISLNAGIEGMGLNSATEINIDALVPGGIGLFNATEIEIGGGVVTINPGGAILMESADLTATIVAAIEMNAGGAIELGSTAGLISLNAALNVNILSGEAIELTALTPAIGLISIASGGSTSITSGAVFNITSDGALWDVGGLTFNAGIVELGWGATTANLASLTATTGAVNWTSGDVNWNTLTNFAITATTMSLAGGTLNVVNGITNLIGATLTINNAAATIISSPILSLNSTQTILAAGRPLKTDIIQPTTANSLAISGVDTIAGGASGMDLTNIANFENYSATNVLLPCKAFTANVPTISLTATAGYNLVYTSPTKIWSWINIPALLFSYTFNSEVIVSAGAPSGQATSLGIYIVLANLTTPSPSNTILFKPVTGRSTPNDSGNSSIALTANQSFDNDQTAIAQGNSYVIRVFASSLDSPNNTTLTNNLLSFNVINAGAL